MLRICNVEFDLSENPKADAISVKFGILPSKYSDFKLVFLHNSLDNSFKFSYDALVLDKFNSVK